MNVRPALKRARLRMILPGVIVAIGSVAVASWPNGARSLRGLIDSLPLALPELRFSAAPLGDSAFRRALASAAKPTPTGAFGAVMNRTAASDGPFAGLNVYGVQHPRIGTWVDRLTSTFKGEYQRSLVRMDKYDDMISAKLAARGMPQDLIYLAMIESEFNPNAKSPAKAVGLWQFMSGTARRFGLTVRGRVDERKDPARETDAALQYLSDLHSRFGSWYLAAAAYNSGEGTVSRALQRVTGKTSGTDADFFRILPSLPRETQDYVPKLIASARVGADPARYGINMQQSFGVQESSVDVSQQSTPAALPAAHAAIRARARHLVGTRHHRPTRTPHRRSSRSR